MTKAYEQGYDDGDQGLDNKNPFTVNSNEYWDYEDGYEDGIEDENDDEDYDDDEDGYYTGLNEEY